MGFLIKNKIVAIVKTDAVVSSVFVISPNATLPDVISFLKDPQFNDVVARIEIVGSPIDFLFNLPNLPIYLNPHTQQVESAVWPHCQKFSLYSDQEKAIKASGFAYLPGLVDQTLTREGLLAISNGFIDLFTHDDDIDNQASKPDFSLLKPDNLRFVDIAKGSPSLDTDRGKVKGYAEAMSSFFSSHLTSQNSAPFIRTLKEYLQSTEVEMAEMSVVHPEGKKAPSYSSFIENRRDTSGIFHAVMMMWVAHDLKVEKLLEDYYPLKNLLKQTCDLVCRLNDIASCKKELNSFARYTGLPAVATPADAERVKPFITSNSVLLKFRAGKPLADAVLETANEYKDILKGFMENAQLLEEGISKNPELNTAVQILFGWVIGHAVWATLSKRYNLQALSSKPMTDCLL